MTTETPMAVEINCTTGEEIIRPLTVDEIAQRIKNAEQYEARKHEEEVAAAARAEAKAALLAKLGITEDEAKLLLA
jgi:alpha-galactosidase/6-phospho-beta-glucosidase family protein